VESAPLTGAGHCHLLVRSLYDSVRHPSITALAAGQQNDAEEDSPPAPVDGKGTQSRVAAYLHNRWKQRSIRGNNPDL